MNATDSEARQRILDAAETLFMEKGYTTVRLRDIAQAVGIKHTTLYHHFPDGKEQLFVEVVERSFKSHQIGIEAAIQDAGEDLRTQLLAVVAWFFNHPAMNLTRMLQSDLTRISPDNSQRLSYQIYDALRLPLEKLFKESNSKGITNVPDPSLAALNFVSLIQTIHSINVKEVQRQKHDIGEQTVDMLLNGWLKR